MVDNTGLIPTDTIQTAIDFGNIVLISGGGGFKHIEGEYLAQGYNIQLPYAGEEGVFHLALTLNEGSSTLDLFSHVLNIILPETTSSLEKTITISGTDLSDGSIVTRDIKILIDVLQHEIKIDLNGPGGGTAVFTADYIIIPSFTGLTYSELGWQISQGDQHTFSMTVNSTSRPVFVVSDGTLTIEDQGNDWWFVYTDDDVTQVGLADDPANNDIISITVQNSGSITDMSYMFSPSSTRGLNSLTDITFSSTVDTSNVTTMKGMFNGCSGITDLD
jgi:hypothetical protein